MYENLQASIVEGTEFNAFIIEKYELSCVNESNRSGFHQFPLP